MNLSLLPLFIVTFFFVSITPGLCMTLAMTLGMTVGLKRTLWMMAGELLGVAIIATAAAIGVAAILLSHPTLFTVFKYLGGAYLAFMGIQMWLSKGKMAIKLESLEEETASKLELALQGFLTAIANPKGWAFFITLLPPFLSPDSSLIFQLLILITIIVILEFICLIVYASGGQSLRLILNKKNNLSLLNKLSGSLLIAVGFWLAFG